MLKQILYPTKIAGKRGSSQSGMTVVELMVTLLIFSIFIGAVFAANRKLTDRYFAEDDIIDAQRNGEVALNMMTSVLRQAGYGAGKNFINPPPGLPAAQSSLSLNSPYMAGISPMNALFNFRSNIATGGRFTDELTVIAGYDYLGSGTIGADNRTINLTNPSVAADGTDNCNNCAVYVDPSPSAVYKIANVAGNTVTLDAANLYEYRSFSTRVHVYRIRAYTFRVVIDANGQPCLRMDDNDTASTDNKNIAEGIEAIHFQFGVAGAGGAIGWQNTLPAATNHENLRAIRIFALVRSRNPDLAFNQGGASTTYSMAGTDIAVTDQFHRKLVSTSVMLRDLVYVDL